MSFIKNAKFNLFRHISGPFQNSKRQLRPRARKIVWRVINFWLDNTTTFKFFATFFFLCAVNTINLLGFVFKQCRRDATHFTIRMGRPVRPPIPWVYHTIPQPLFCAFAREPLLHIGKEHCSDLGSGLHLYLFNIGKANGKSVMEKKHRC